MNKPVIILVKPQLGENIGMVTRAVWNCALPELRLVDPRKGWLNDHTLKAAAGAEHRIEDIKVFNTTQEATADLNYIFATTARRRRMEKPIVTPKTAADYMVQHSENKVGILFGRERFGLDNEDVGLANSILEIPLNPEYCSLNLAQAVLLVAYEWYQKGVTSDIEPRKYQQPLAKKEEIYGFYNHLEGELDKAKFFLPLDKKPRMIRNLRNIFERIGLTHQDVQTLRGVITALTRSYLRNKKK